MASTILIAEDDLVLRGLYLKKFEMAGYSVGTAENGEQLIRMIPERRPDLVICDIHMPKADGFKVLETFPKGQRTFPIILVTNFDDGAFRVRAEELGADEYFVKKNMTIRKLLEMAKRLMNK